ncbi:MAG: hypothetical protein ACM3PE_01860 [Deltaproteobacteria bacterium]
MENRPVVHLSKLFLWPETTRFQAYPEFLCQVDPEEGYQHMADLARRAGDQRMLDNRHVKHENIVRNFPGLELDKQGEPLLRGVGIMQKRDKRYFLSSWGRELRSSYLEDPKGERWKVTLAAGLLRREPRIRSLVKGLSQQSSQLAFPASGFFNGSYAKARLVSGERDYLPFAPPLPDQANLQSFMNELRGWAMGDWREELEFSEVIYAGAQGTEISTWGLGGAAKGAFFLFHHLGLVEEAAGELRWLGEKAARVMGPELAADFGWMEDESSNMLEIIKGLIIELRSDNGFLVASQLMAKLQEMNMKDGEKELAKLLDAGYLRLEAWDYGQKRHGRGLFGQADKQLVKFSFYGGDQE